MQKRTIVDDRYDACAAIISRLLSEGSISEAQMLQDILRRTFVVGAASYFEQVLKDVLLEFVSSRSGGDTAVTALVKMSLVDRGFHQMFQWEGKNANKFLSHFGPDIGESMKKVCSGDLKGSVQSFMELGNLRNCIVHQNFHVFYFEKTLDECYASYKTALAFVDFVLRALSAANSAPT